MMADISQIFQLKEALLTMLSIVFMKTKKVISGLGQVVVL